MIYHKPQDRSQEHLRPNNLSKVLLRGLMILGLIAILTYYGKVQNPSPNIVKIHNLVGWNLLTPDGISSLLVLSNDNIDSNNIKTGHRIWINPPKHPKILEQEGLRFKGKRLTLIGDSLRSSTLSELASTVDSGGAIFLIGAQQRNLRALQAENPHLLIYQDTLPESSFFIPSGEDEEIFLRKIGSKDFFLDIKTGAYRIFYTSDTSASGPSSETAYSLGVFTKPFQKIPPFVYGDTLYQSLIFSGDSNNLKENPTRVPLNQFHRGVLFYEETKPDQIILNKVEFKHWDGSRQ